MTIAMEHLRISSLEGRLDVVIDRPHARNALSIGTLEEVAAVFTEYAADESVKVAVISGAGDKAFAAGGDIKELSTRRSAEDAAALFDLGSRATEAVRRFPVPVVAALNGVALGGAAELAVSCDFRLAARHAAIGFVQAQLALTTGFGGIASLQDLIGVRRALRMLLDGTILPAEEGREAGLVDAVAGEGEALEDLVARFIEPMLKRPVALLRDMKAVALAGEDAAGRAAVAKVERERFVRAWVSEEHWAAAEKVLSRGR
ncbi:MAG: enoyl-CoA hydratase/isomerase family protein [Hyphomicrobiales bacterium]|nr:enoyl-CoA hydratase/isomerase family protein [Hyphomicrobiales bacterium]